MNQLSLPDVRFRESFLQAMEEFRAEGRAGDDSMVGADLEQYAAGWESERGFSAYVEDLLAAVLPEAAALGIDQALVTCDEDNLGSRAVIETNGGVLEDRRGRKRRYWVPTRPGDRRRPRA